MMFFLQQMFSFSQIIMMSMTGIFSYVNRFTLKREHGLVRELVFFLELQLENMPLSVQVLLLQKMLGTLK